MFRALLVFLFAVTGTLVDPAVPASAPPPFRPARDLPALVEGASLIIVGKIEGVKPGRVAGQGDAQLEFNDVRVQVEKRLKGEAPQVITVEEVSQARRVVISPMGPPFQAGERYVLFLMRGEGERYVPLPRGRFYLEGGRVGPLDMEEAKFLGQIESSVKGMR